MEFTCSFPDCNNNSVSRTFFPYPIDFYLCMQWVQSTGDPQLWQEFLFAGAQSCLKKFVCSNHFPMMEFKVFGDPTSGLKPNAFPLNQQLLQSETVKTEPPEELSIVKQEIEEVDVIANEAPTQFFVQYQTSEYIKTENISTEEAILQDSQRTEDYLEYPENPLQSLIPASTDNVEELEKKYINTILTVEKNSWDRNMKNRIAIAQKRAQIKANETPEEAEKRRAKEALQRQICRANETEEHRAMRLEKERIRIKIKRENENEETAKIRRYQNALRASIRRSQETPEQRQERKLKDALRAAERRKSETPEERERRLQKDRERVFRKRINIKLTETPEEREERLRKDRERVNRKRRRILAGVPIDPNILGSLNMDSSMSDFTDFSGDSSSFDESHFINEPEFVAASDSVEEGKNPGNPTDSNMNMSYSDIIQNDPVTSTVTSVEDIKDTNLEKNVSYSTNMQVTTVQNAAEVDHYSEFPDSGINSTITNLNNDNCDLISSKPSV